VHDCRADQAHDDDRAKSVPHEWVRSHQVHAERPLRPAVDEKAENEKACDRQRVESIEEDQAPDDGSRNGEGASAGAGHGAVSGYIVKRYYPH
jgi:hypothetical protein